MPMTVTWFLSTSKCPVMRPIKVLVVSGTFSPTLFPPSPLMRGKGLTLEFYHL